MNITINNEKSTEEYDLKIEMLDLSVEPLSKRDFPNKFVIADVSKMLSDINKEDKFLIKDISSIDIDDSMIHFKLQIEKYYLEEVEFFEILNFLDVLKMTIEDNLSEEYQVTFINVNMKKFEKDIESLMKSVERQFKFEIQDRNETDMKINLILNKKGEDTDKNEAYNTLRIDYVEVNIRFGEDDFLTDSEEEEEEPCVRDLVYDMYEDLIDEGIACWKSELDFELNFGGVIFGFELDTSDKPFSFIDIKDQIAEKVYSLIESYELFDNTEVELNFDISFVRHSF